MAISRAQKEELVRNYVEQLNSSEALIITDYRGVSASEMTVLRRKMREANVGYRVVKNTLARFAMERVNRDELSSFFQGPVAIAFGYDEVTEPAKVLTDYIQSSKASIDIKGGFLADRRLTLEDVQTLAKLPSREVLLARVLAGMQWPIIALVSVFNSPMRGVIGVLQARIQQLGGE